MDIFPIKNQYKFLSKNNSDVANSDVIMKKRD